VGKADNKNPKGQQPGPQDNNNGYECDGNHGIAKGNPAHTGCQPGEDTPSDTCPDGSMPDDHGKCEAPEPTCPDGSMPNDDGTCDAPTPVCPDGSMPSDEGTCPNGETPVCPDGSMPNDDGTCDTPTPVCPDGSMPNDDGACLPTEPPICPDGSMPNDDGTCDTPVPGTNRPPTVAGVEQFAQPPAAVEQFAGPSAPMVGPSGILPSTGAGVLMNALAATGLGLLLVGAATLLLRRRSTQN
jgi:LPXTG-motif cell wall-anchored protein